MPPPTSCSPSTPFLFTVSLVLSIHSFLLFLSFSLCISSSCALGVVGLRWFFVDRGSLRWFVVGLCGGSASEDAKKLVDEERAFACAEIENARAAVQRVEEALQEHERTSRASGKQDVGELMKEVQEASRIIMLHQPSKVMDMELELRALRMQLAEKSKHSLRLQKELAKSKRVVENGSQSFELDGHEALGSYLRIQPCSDNAPELSKCSI
ncbi:stomatal closure-related actin-binding protein 1-like isoform X2 [Quercus suber]|uniref:stomatal closure-related actin-binding protein 1-like isoform X2 n=1 Tax=Quercus suber TaxID=58331 RepID=UPI0032DE45F3